MFVGVRRTSKYDPKELQKRPLYKAIITFKSTKKLTVNHQHTFCFCCPFPKSNKNLKHKFFIIFYPRGPSPPPFLVYPSTGTTNGSHELSVLTIRMERKDLVARKSRSMAILRAAEAPLAKGAFGGSKGR